MNGSCEHRSNTMNSIPPSSSKFNVSSNMWIQKIHKYLLPKSTRLKLLCFFLLLLAPILFFYLSCFSSTSLSTFCDSSSTTPNLSFFLRNKTYRHFAHQSRHLPQCIVIGIRKAGTRALLNYLDIHPNIVTASKEIHFFDVDENYMQGLEYYRKLMPYSFEEQLTIEKTPAYFTEIMVPERVYRMNSTIKLLLIVREPVTRLISDYTQLREQRVKRNKTPIPFEYEVLDRHGDIDATYKPVLTSMYYTHMVRWMEFFSWDQIHIIDGEELVDNPYRELYKVETFLGLEHRIRKENFSFNETKGFYCVNKDTLRTCLHETKGRKHPFVDQDLLQRLYKFYAPRNDLFFKFINRTFDWKKLE